MAQYNYTDLVVSVAGQDISAEVTEISGLRQERPTEETHGASDADVAHLEAGVTRNDDITIGGFFDDAANTPVTLLRDAGIGTTVAFVVTIGGTKTRTGNAIVASFEDRPGRDESTKYTAVLRPTGAVVIA